MIFWKEVRATTLTNGAVESASLCPSSFRFLPRFFSQRVPSSASLHLTIMLHNLALMWWWRHSDGGGRATLPLAAANHCHPTVEFNRQEPRSGAESTKGRKLEVDGATLVTLTDSIAVFVLSWEVGHWKKGALSLFPLYFTIRRIPQHRNCRFTLSSFERGVLRFPKQLYIFVLLEKWFISYIRVC